MPNDIENKTYRLFQSEQIRKITFGVILFTVAWAMYGFNRHTPLVADDMVFAVYIREHNFIEMIEALYKYYMGWGGRVVAHIIAVFFLSLDKSIFNVANTIVYIIFNLLILFHGLGKNFISPVALIFVNLMLFLCTPAFGQDFLWLDGAANYLWCAVIVLTFFVPYRLQTEKSENILKKDKPSAVFMFFAGTVAAWTNENMSVAVFFVILAFLLLTKKKNNRVFLWQITGGVGAILGASLLILAPGNFNRLAVEGGGQHIDIAKNFFDITAMFIDPHFLLCPLVAAFIFGILSQKYKSEQFWLVYLAGVVVSMYAMLASPYYTDRAKLGSLVFAVVLALYFYGGMEFNTHKSRFLVLIVGAVLAICLHSEWHIASVDIKAYDRIEQARIAKIIEERGKKEEIILEDNEAKSRYVAAWELVRLSKDKNSVMNKAYSDFYGAKFIRVK